MIGPAASYSRKGKPLTTIGAGKLNFRVRYGNGCDLPAIATGPVFFCISFLQNRIMPYEEPSQATACCVG